MSFNKTIASVFICYLLILGTASCSNNAQVEQDGPQPTPTIEVAEEIPEAAVEEPAPTTEPVQPVEQITYSCGTAEEIAAAENIAQLYQVPTIEIMDYFCQGVSFDYITLALETTKLADVPLETVIQMVQSGQTWEQVWQELGVLFTECGTPEDQDMAADIADTYGITYEEVLGLFCQGFSFDEILLALETAAQTNSQAQDILVMRRDGKSWDDIWKDLGVIE